MEKQAKYIEEFPDRNINLIRTWDRQIDRSLLTSQFAVFLQGMRNLSISCSLVSLIILGTSLVVFWIGLFQREVPPVLVVSVLYLLSGWSHLKCLSSPLHNAMMCKTETQTHARTSTNSEPRSWFLIWIFVEIWKPFLREHGMKLACTCTAKITKQFSLPSLTFQLCFQPFPSCSPFIVAGLATSPTAPMRPQLSRRFWYVPALTIPFVSYVCTQSVL